MNSNELKSNSTDSTVNSNQLKSQLKHNSNQFKVLLWEGFRLCVSCCWKFTRSKISWKLSHQNSQLQNTIKSDRNLLSQIIRQLNLEKLASGLSLSNLPSSALLVGWTLTQDFSFSSWNSAFNFWGCFKRSESGSHRNLPISELCDWASKTREQAMPKGTIISCPYKNLQENLAEKVS